MFGFGQRLLQIVRRDDVGGRKQVDALEARNIDQHAAGHQAADVLDAELVESAARPDVAELVAIVEAVAPHLVRERVELGADLAELGDDQLFVDLAAHSGSAATAWCRC